MNDTSRMLQELADRVLGEHCSADVRLQAERGDWPGRLWELVEATGLPQAGVPDELGGAGASLLEAMTVARSAGRHAVPLPLVESMLANWLLSQAGHAPLAGPLSLSAAAEAAAPVLVRSGGTESILSGRCELVPWGVAAAHVVVVARVAEGGAAVVAVPIGACSIHRGTSVAREPRDTLVFDQVPLDAALVGERQRDGYAADALSAGALARCHQMVGAMEWALAQCLSYVRDRAQFGKPIGGFQAVQHLIAELACQASAAAVAADSALLALGTAHAYDAVGAAKSRVGEAAGQVAAIAHQVHGAMGYSHEYPLHYRTRRLWSWRDEFGSERFWQIRAGRDVSAQGGDSLWPGLMGVQ